MERDIRQRGHRIRFGIVTPPMWRTWDELLDLWIRAEGSGFDMAFNTDHFLSDWEGEDGPTLEAWTTLAALAREVPRIEVGTYVTGVTHRPIAVLAKQAITLDQLSEGRLILGIGAAWNEREHNAYGIRFPPPGERVSMVADALEAFHGFETCARLTYRGRSLVLEDAPFEPKPVNRHIPILIGSTRPRMMGLAARRADYIDFAQASTTEVGELAARMAASCRSAARDPDEVVWMHEQVAGPDPAADLAARVDALAPMGVSVFLVNIWPRSDPALVDRAGSVLDRLRRSWAA